MENRNNIQINNSHLGDLVAALFFSIVPASILIHTLTIEESIFEINPFFAYLTLIAFVIGIIYYAYNFLTLNSKITFTTDGIDHSRKGFIRWENVWYINSEFKQNEEVQSTKLQIKLKNDEVPIEIYFTFLRVSLEEVRNFIANHVTKNSIIDLGHEENIIQ